MSYGCIIQFDLSNVALLQIPFVEGNSIASVDVKTNSL